MRLLAVSAILVAALTISGCASKGQAYPEKYLLSSGEVPATLKISPVPEELQQIGFTTNPGQVPAGLIQNLGEEFQGFAPDQVWLEFLQKASESDEVTGGLMIASGFWNDPKKVDDAVNQIKANDESEICSQQEMGRALRDGNVVVVIGGDESMSTFVASVESALKAKAPGLTSLC